MSISMESRLGLPNKRISDVPPLNTKSKPHVTSCSSSVNANITFSVRIGSLLYFF